MAYAVNRIGQVAFSVADVDRAEAFYRDVHGLRQLHRQEAPKGYVPPSP
jgi:catechol 2,3-dioxygenase-like lactoylglutathione lyase family enzyme